MPGIKSAVDGIVKDQSKSNWIKFQKSLKASDLKYYDVHFDNGKVNKKEDLRKAYAQLYDSKGKFAYRIPITLTEKGKIRGATIYLKGLLNTNRN